MESFKAKRIGQSKILISITFALFFAYTIMAFLLSEGEIDKGLFWIVYVETQFIFNLIFACFIFYAIGYFLGGIAGVRILVKKKDAVFEGIKTSFFTLVISMFIICLCTYLLRIVYFGFNILEIGSYILKPIIIVTVVGSIPTAIIGIIYGLQVEKSGRLEKN